MAIWAKAGGGGDRAFEPAPEGVWQAVCVDVIDLGVLDVTWQGATKRQHKINIAWQLDCLREDGKPYLVFKRYTLSLHEKAGLRKDLESWRGRKFTRDEEAGFDLETVLGANCLINIQHNRTDAGTYANVVSIMPLARNMTPIKADGYVRKVDRPETTTEPPPHEPDHQPPPLTDEDIPFAWALPLVLPATAMLGMLLS